MFLLSFTRGALIVGDLHFGIEERMHAKGIFASDISNSLANKLLLIIKRQGQKDYLSSGT